MIPVGIFVKFDHIFILVIVTVVFLKISGKEFGIGRDFILISQIIFTSSFNVSGTIRKQFNLIFVKIINSIYL